ncbi:MAG: hemerythrin domain-containing protein [Burkholderiales bacterium]|nr:hemerythrin domain-containing protein [Burkholderiales bacterium]
MNATRQVPRLLDDEHRTLLELLGRLESAIVRRETEAWPALARALVPQLERESARHFDFEERELFPLLAEGGDGAIAALLTEEHESIRAVAAELLPLARAAALGRLAAPEPFRRLGLEFTERQVAHIQKETMALLPLLDDLLDDDTDRRLAFEHAGA